MNDDLFSLHGHVALVTGASRNIGAAIATSFANAGADLLLVARRDGPLLALAQRLRSQTDRRIETVAVDVTAPGAVESIAEHAKNHLPPIDVLVNNAYSVGEVASVFDADDAAWEQALATNVMAPMRLCRTFGRRMTEAGGGNIINLISGSGVLPSPGLGAYGASKAALWMLTRYLATEGAPTVRANAICPGLISDSGEPRSAAHHALLPSVPMGRVGRPEEIVGAALYLASAASSYTTGEVIFVNGGRPW